MEEFFVDVCEQLSAHVWLEALLVIIGTCFLEDVARCGVGLLVANGQIGWRLAFVSMTLGGVVGDLALYVIGRYASVFLYRHRWLDPLRLAWVKEQFRRHAFKAVMVARFIPGARTLVYCSAGIVRYPMPRFTFLLFLAAVIQSVFYLKAADVINPYLRANRTGLIVFGVIVAALLIGHHALAKRNRSKIREAVSDSGSEGMPPSAP